MIELSPYTARLALHVAAAMGVPLDEAIRIALEDKARGTAMASAPRPPRDQSAEAVAERRARTERCLAAVDAMPVLDPRSPREIMDDLNPL